MNGLSGWLLVLPETLAQWLWASMWWILGVACFAGVVWCVAAVWWRGQVQRALAERTRVGLVPSVTFDPGEDEIGWFAGQLSRVPAAAGALPRPARAVRLRLGSSGEGRLEYELEGPARAASVLRMSAYNGVEARDPRASWVVPRIHFEGAPPVGRAATVSLTKTGPETEPAPEPDAVVAGEPPVESASTDSSRRLHVARAELVLERPDHRPLAGSGVNPDPLQLLAGAMSHVQGPLGESVQVAVDLLPVPAAQVDRRRRMLLHRARRRGPSAFGERLEPGAGGGQWGSVANDFLAGMNGGRAPGSSVSRGSGRVPRQSDLAEGVGKFDRGAEVFAVQVLVRSVGTHPARARARLHQALAALDAGRGENGWRPVGPRRGMWRPYSNVWWRRRGFDRRFASGQFSPSRRQWVTTGEIAGWLKPPTRHCAATNVVRCGGTVPPAPAELPTWTGQRGVVPLGTVTGADGKKRLAAVPEKDVLFSASFGRSGFGKSEKALLESITMAYGGYGTWFLDPHGSALNRARPYLAHPAINPRLWDVDLSAAGQEDLMCAWNPLSMEGRSLDDLQDVVGSVVGAITSAMGWGDGAPRARTILSHSVRALCMLSWQMCRQGRPDLQPTLFQVTTLLTDERWRDAVLVQLPGQMRKFWQVTFPKYASDSVPVVTQMMDRLETSTSARAFLGSARSTYDARTAMDTSRVVLLRPTGAGGADKILTSLLIFDLFLAGLSREGVAQEELATLWAHVDELTAVDGAAKGTIPAILEQLRKYEIRFNALTQMVMRLREETRQALMQNQSLLSAAGADTDEAAFVTRRMRPVTPETLEMAPKYTYVTSTQLHGARTSPFRVEGVAVDQVLADYYNPEGLEEQRATVDVNLRRRPVREILASLEEHDDAILAHLWSGVQAGGDTGSGAREARGVVVELGKGEGKAE